VLFFYGFYYEDNQFDNRQGGEDYAADAVEGVEVIDDVVKAEETQRVGENEAQKDDCVSMFVVGKL